MTEADYCAAQSHAIDICAAALAADVAGRHDEAAAALETMVNTDIALTATTFFDMLRQVFDKLHADDKEALFRQWEEDAVVLRATP